MQKGMPKTKRLFQSRLLDDFRVKKIKFELSHNFPFLVLSCRIDVPQQKLDNNWISGIQERAIRVHKT